MLINRENVRFYYQERASDLMMGSVLKQTDRANLLTIFGEPDITIEEQPDGQYVVDIRGPDI